MNDIKSVFNKQKEFFYLGKTNDINFRIDNLRKLKEVIKVNENKILEALNKDLGKSNFESYATEIGIVYDEINVHIKNIKKWARRERKKSSIIYYPSKSYVYKEPYGVTLIIGPFNYPFQLVIAPLIGAISAGNTAIIKPSENTKNISILLSAINREIVSMGYMTQFGLFHDNMFNQFNLSCDLMEPFRIFVDRKIISMNIGELDSKAKLRIIEAMNDTIDIDGQNMYFNNALKIYCKSVFDALNNSDVLEIKFWKYEL